MQDYVTLESSSKKINNYLIRGHPYMVLAECVLVWCQNLQGATKDTLLTISSTFYKSS